MVRIRHLGPTAVAALMVSLHYGTGFLLGTGEQVSLRGPAGTLYAVSTALGMLAFLLFAGFYWRKREKIWTLLGRRHGVMAERVVALMSWAWMVGVTAAQIIGGAFVLRVMGLPVPVPIAMVMLTTLLLLISLSPKLNLSYAAYFLLALSSLALVFSLWNLNALDFYPWSIRAFAGSLSNQELGELLGIPLSTVLLTALGMDFHEYLVDARSVQAARASCLLASSVLFLLAFLPAAVVLAATERGLFPSNADARAALPLILAAIGARYHPWLGFALLLSLLTMAMLSGSGLLRAMNNTLRENRSLVPLRGFQIGITPALVNATFVFACALTGDQIVSVIVSFYAIYVAGTLMPFLAYLVEERGNWTFTGSTIPTSAMAGSAVATAVLTVNVLNRILPPDGLIAAPFKVALMSGIGGSVELSILLLGIAASFLVLLAGARTTRLPVVSQTVPSAGD